MDKIVIDFTEEELCAIFQMARLAEIGGRSNFRNKESRAECLSMDQSVGQLGEAALSKYLTGNIDLYIKTREFKNRNPNIGDDGCDLIGYRVDIKTSLMRYNMPPEDYNLLVRPTEEHPNHFYIQALVARNSTSVILMGWASSEELPVEPVSSGSMAGAKAIKCADLHPLGAINKYNAGQLPGIW